MTIISLYGGETGENSVDGPQVSKLGGSTPLQVEDYLFKRNVLHEVME